LHQNTHYRVSFRTLYDVNVSPTQVFEDLYGKESHAIWLDSASHEQQQRYSIMSGMTGPLSKRIEYFGKEHEDTGMYITDIHGNQEVRNVSILDYLQEELDCVHLDGVLPDLPFVGGFLGYLGYEVGQETELKMNFTTKATETKVPTAAFIFCDQALIHDHIDQTWHLILLSDAKSSEATVWLDVTEARVRQIQPRHLNGIPVHTKQIPLAWKPSRSRSTYQANIDQCHGEIRRGESYELCLTNHLETTVSEKKDPWDLYQLLRRRNPAPFAAYAKLGPSLTVCCSSPERFVSVQPNPNGELLVEAKPIKGTVARSRAGRDDQIVAALTKDVKNRAENLMIVDLLRNDLNRVCQTASVHVPRLFGVESFATVHQMVSTIRGILKQNKTAVHVLRAAFPGGSMTGAPKRRSMEILQALEEGVPRGVYSGSLGYLSVHGCMDMNIVIRTAVIADGGKVSIGAGGAITVLSEFEDEYEEMLLKARAVQDAVELWASLEDKRSQGMITEQQKATTKS
jgi:para-aminobenzoate synthetase